MGASLPSAGFVAGPVCGVCAGHCDLLSLGPLQVEGTGLGLLSPIRVGAGKGLNVKCLGVELTPGHLQNAKAFTRLYKSIKREDLLQVKKGERVLFGTGRSVSGQPERESCGDR